MENERVDRMVKQLDLAKGWKRGLGTREISDRAGNPPYATMIPVTEVQPVDWPHERVKNNALMMQKKA
jgi:hypothetical protein